MWERGSHYLHRKVESSWNVMAHSDAREGKWRGNWRMEWVAGTLHTTSEHGVSSITTADAHTSAASSRLNWRPRRFKWTRPFRRKTKSGFCACVIAFQLVRTWCWHYMHRNGPVRLFVAVIVYCYQTGSGTLRVERRCTAFGNQQRKNVYIHLHNP